MHNDLINVFFIGLLFLITIVHYIFSTDVFCLITVYSLHHESCLIVCVLNYSSHYSMRLCIAVYNNEIIVFCC